MEISQELKTNSSQNNKNSFVLPPQPENYLQISNIIDTNKRQLIDYKGNITRCDIYGVPQIKYFNGISGISNYNIRLKKGLIKRINYDNKDLYIPIVSKFEGTSMFPRPLSIPFANKEINMIKLMKEIKNEKRISALKNKVLLKLKKPLDDNSSIPKFICQKISEDNSKDKKILMNLIDKYIHKKKKENKYQNDFDQKNKEIIALKEYKKYLNQNIDNKLYNGKIINASEQGDIKEKYDTIKKLIYNNSFINKKKEKKENKMISSNLLKNFRLLKKSETMNNILKHNEIFNRNNSCINIFSKKISFFSKKNNNISLMQFDNNSSIKSSSIFKNINRNNTNKNAKRKSKSNISDIENEKSYDESISMTKSCFLNNKKNISWKSNLYSPNNLCFDNINLKVNSDNKNKTSFGFFSKKEFSKIKDNMSININDKNKDNFSFISESKYNNNQPKNNFNDIKYKTMKDLTTISDKEKELLKGYKTPLIHNKIFLKHSNLDRKDYSFENYKNDLELFKKVNKVALAREEKKNLFKEKLLMKKIQEKKLYEKNFRKINF